MTTPAPPAANTPTAPAPAPAPAEHKVPVLEISGVIPVLFKEIKKLLKNQYSKFDETFSKLEQDIKDLRAKHERKQTHIELLIAFQRKIKDANEEDKNYSFYVSGTDAKFAGSGPLMHGYYKDDGTFMVVVETIPAVPEVPEVPEHVLSDGTKVPKKEAVPGKPELYRVESLANYPLLTELFAYSAIQGLSLAEHLRQTPPEGYLSGTVEADKTECIYIAMIEDKANFLTGRELHEHYDHQVQFGKDDASVIQADISTAATKATEENLNFNKYRDVHSQIENTIFKEMPSGIVKNI